MRPFNKGAPVGGLSLVGQVITNRCNQYGSPLLKGVQRRRGFVALQKHSSTRPCNGFGLPEKRAPLRCAGVSIGRSGWSSLRVGLPPYQRPRFLTLRASRARRPFRLPSRFVRSTSFFLRCFSLLPRSSCSILLPYSRHPPSPVLRIPFCMFRTLFHFFPTWDKKLLTSQFVFMRISISSTRGTESKSAN